MGIFVGLQERMRYWGWAAAMLAIVLLAAPGGAQSVRAGIEAWQRGEYAAAVDIWRPLAVQGDADAAFNLGQAYRLGRGAGTDLAQAQRWFEQAARKGHLDAQTTLGLLLFENGNRIGGLRWLKQAAERGEARALLVYGTALFNGDGVPPDPVLAYAYVSRAAAQGLAPARSTLAEMDRIMPVEQRQKGVTIALEKAAVKPPASTKSTGKVAATKAPTPKPASSKAAPPKASVTKAATSSPARGRWRVQLGAFSKRGSAETLYRKLSGNGALAGRQAYYVPAGAVTRLQVGPFESRAAAASACASLKGQACFAVEAK